MNDLCITELCKWSLDPQELGVGGWVAEEGTQAAIVEGRSAVGDNYGFKSFPLKKETKICLFSHPNRWSSPG